MAPLLCYPQPGVLALPPFCGNANLVERPGLWWSAKGISTFYMLICVLIRLVRPYYSDGCSYPFIVHHRVGRVRNTVDMTWEHIDCRQESRVAVMILGAAPRWHFADRCIRTHYITQDYGSSASQDVSPGADVAVSPHMATSPRIGDARTKGDRPAFRLITSRVYERIDVLGLDLTEPWIRCTRT